jgi:hypothetical protein
MSKVVILQARDSEVIHGVANFTALTGNGVILDPTNVNNLALATGVRAFVLQRDIVDAISLDESVFNLNLATPTKKGLEATARRVTLLEVEGAERLNPSGTGPITPDTAAHTALEWNAGVLRVAQVGSEVAGYLRAQLTPLYPEAGTARILVELL